MLPQTVSKERLRRASARWHDPGHSGHTYYLPPGARLPPSANIPDPLGDVIARSETGAALFWSLGGAHVVLPPFPVPKEAEFDGWNTGPLHSILDRPRTVLVLLLRLGGYAVGIFEGERLARSKVGSPFVKGRHKKGGSSSGRFARRREEQARGLFGRACETLRQVVEDGPTAPEHFITGGDRLTLQAFEKRCPYAGRFASIKLSRVLDVPDPRLAVLKDTPRQLYSGRIADYP